MIASEFTKPGVFPHVPAAIYHQIDGASSHRLGDLLRSPAHCRQNIEHPSDPSDAMLIGEAAHLAILTPAQLASSYIVAGRCEGITGKGERCAGNGSKLVGAKWFCGTHHKGDSDALPAGCKKITIEQWDAVTSAADAVRDHETVKAMLDATAEDDRELTVLWEDEEKGILCKARFDCLVRPGKYGGIGWDLKSCEDASEDAFSRQIERYGYYRQAAHYLEGAHSAGIEVDRFYLVCFEKEPPYGVGLVEFDDDLLKLGARENRVLLRRYAKCKESGIWPGYAPEPRITRPSDWLRKRIERLEQTTF